MMNIRQKIAASAFVISILPIAICFPLGRYAMSKGCELDVNFQKYSAPCMVEGINITNDIYDPLAMIAFFFWLVIPCALAWLIGEFLREAF